MKKTIRYTIFACFALFLLVMAFYLWAFQANLPSEQHVLLRGNRVSVVQVDTAALNDSVFRIMTYNLGYLSGLTNNQPVQPAKTLFDTHLKKASDLLRQKNLDIIAFQEIDYGSDRSYNMDQEELLAKAGTFPYVARAVNWDKRYVPFPYWPPTVHFGRIVSGQSLLSKYPIMDQKVDTLSKVQSAPFFYNHFYLERLAQVCRVAFQGQELIVINVHLEAFDRDTRAIHSAQVLAIYRHYAAKYPTILLGDFNSSPDEVDATIAPFLEAADMQAVALAGDRLTYSYDSADPSARLDYIFYNDKLRLLAGEVITDAGTISDHLPVMASFRLAD